MANTVRIKATLDDGVSSKLDKIRDKFDRLGKSKGAASILQGVGLGAGAAAFNLLGSAASGAADLIGDSITAASDMNESLSKSKVVFGQSSAEVEKFGRSAASSMGLSNQAALEAAGTFGNLLLSVGKTSAEAATMSTKMVALAADLGSFNNVPVEDALLAIRSGLTGESEPLKKFGVNLNETTLKAKALTLGLYNGKGVLDASAKATAAYAIILEQTTTAQGDFARTSTGMANQQKILAAKLKDTEAELGKKMIPVVIAAQEAFIGFFDVLDGHSGQIGSIGDSIAEQLKSGTVEGLKQTKAALEQGIASLADQNDPIAEMLSGGQIAELKSQLDTVNLALSRGGTAFANWGGSAASVTQEVAGAIGAIPDATEAMAAKVKVNTVSAADAFSQMTDSLKTSAQSAIDKAFDPTIEAYKLMGLNAAESAAQRALAAGKATGAERNALAEARKAQAEQLAAMTLAGQTTAGAYTKGIADLKSNVKASSGAARAALQSVLDKILALEAHGKIDINVKTSPLGGARAHGGPVAANKAYIVGEQGPEVFMPSTGGSIIPNGGGGGSGSPVGGGVTVNIYSNFAPTAAQAREIVALVSKGQYYELQRAAPTLGRT